MAKRLACGPILAFLFSAAERPVVSSARVLSCSVLDLEVEPGGMLIVVSGVALRACEQVYGIGDVEFGVASEGSSASSKNMGSASACSRGALPRCLATAFISTMGDDEPELEAIVKAGVGLALHEVFIRVALRGTTASEGAGQVW